MSEELPASTPSSDERLRLIRAELGACQRCKLGRTRNTIAYGQGNGRAELVFVGEGPGADEDLSGIPFVGKAGQLLTKMIGAMGYTRDDVYICNIVKCRPPQNRKPEPDEIAACLPFVEAQLQAIHPKVIVLLGATAAQALLGTTRGINALRSRWTEWRGIPVMPTYHPSYLLRVPEHKRLAWEDLRLVMERLGRK